MFSSSVIGLVTIFLLAALKSSSSQLPTAIHGLQDQVFPLRTQKVAELSCEYRDAIQILWSVNSTRLINGRRIPPFEATSAMKLNHTTTTTTISSISFPLSANVNNTRIDCIVFGAGYQTNASSTAYITIADVPLPQPTPHLSIVDFHYIHITWDAPFSFPDFPIMNYTLNIQLSNEYSDHIVVAGNTQSHNLTLNYSLSSCTNVTVTLTAQNEVGYSNSGIVSQGLPAAPKELIVREPDVSVTFSKDDIPHVQVDFIFPKLCQDNDATYFLRFFDEEGIVAYTNKVETVPWTQGGMKTTIDAMNNAIKKGMKYEVVLYISTMGGNTSVSFEIDTSRGYQDSTGANAGFQPDHPINYTTYLIIGVAGGGVVILLVIIIIIAIVILVWRKKLKSRKKVCSENALKTMVQNPVYDNQIEVIYDEIPISTDNDKFLQSLPQGPEENDEGYTSVRSTPVQITAIPDLKPENQDPDDPYTVMNSIGTVLPRLSLTDDDDEGTDHPELSRTASRSKRPENQYHFK